MITRFITKLVLVLLPAFIILVSVNYFGDAANLFSGNYEIRIAKGMLSGNNVTNVADYNERLVQRYVVGHSKMCPEVLVIGSSRTLEIDSSYFPGKTFFNNSVSGASIEDLVAIYEMYEQKACKPKNIIIGLDPWTLNKNSGQTRWVAINSEYNAFLRELNKDTITQNDDMNRYSQLISPSYFISSLNALIKSRKLAIVKTTNNPMMTRLSDGSVSYGADYRNRTPAQISDMAKEYAKVNNIYSVENFNELSPQAIFLLESLVAKLEKEHVGITFFLSPYNPIVYHIFETNKQYSQISQSEIYYRDLAKKHGITVIGSFNPRACDMDETLFWDGMHSKPAGLKKLLEANRVFQ